MTGKFHYSLKQLQVFLATAETENISRAAKQLSMSQSAASNALKELETQFDMRLFQRIGKRLQLNDLGNALRPQAHALLEQANALEQAFSQHQSIGSLRLGATLTIGNYLAVPLIAQFKQRHPGANVRLNVANTKAIVDQLCQFEADMALIEGEINHPDLLIEPWIEDELQVFCAPNHPWAEQTVNNDTLLQASWIIREPGSGTRQSFDRAMSGLLSQLNISLELQHTEAIKRAVEANLGISCLSTVCLNEAFKRGSLARIYTPELNLNRQFYRVQHRQKFHSEGLKQWIALCNDYSATTRALKTTP